MKRIGIFHTKGGVGKSVLTAVLADLFSSLHDKRILVVDIDPQGSSSEALIPRKELEKGIQEGKSLAKALSAFKEHKLKAEHYAQFTYQRKAQSTIKRQGSYPLAALDVLTLGHL